MTIIVYNGLRFSVAREHDADAGAPWEREDGHGSVRHVRANHTGHHNKRPGELVLNGDFLRGGHVYDFADACKQARRDDWGSYGWQGAGAGMTRRQFAAQMAREDFDRLRAWCREEWYYLGVIVTLLDIESNPTDAQQCLWGVESGNESYLTTVAQDLATDCALEIQPRLEYGSTGGVYRSGSRSWIVSGETAE